MMKQSTDVAYDVTQIEEMLLPHHLKSLREKSGISDAVIAGRGYRSIIHPSELISFGFKRYQSRMVSKAAPTLLVPLHALDGTVPYFLHRPDVSRIRRTKRRNGEIKEVEVKYETPEGVSLRADCHPLCRERLKDPRVRIIITEGQKKGDSAVSRDEVAIALPGVWGFKGKNEYGGIDFSADLDRIPLNDNRLVVIAYDSDLLNNRNVKDACERLIVHARRKGANLKVARLPDGKNEKKVGLDDFFVNGNTVEDLLKLADSPSPPREPLPPKIELLDLPPSKISKPLQLVDGRAYAATWLYTKIQREETKDKDGTIRKHDPPLETVERYRFIVRDDGFIFANIGHDYAYSQTIRPRSELGFEVHLLESPKTDRLWSKAGLAAFHTGNRPDPVKVFNQIADIINRFVDFEHSLAGQKEMSKLIACYILATWFLDAFTVIGFLWPNGDKGSGKTKVLLLVSELSYLGEMMGSGGSYTSLRDLADYGATMCFDDAEGFADAKKCDPDKRNLFLAGNRKGSTIPVKEPTGDKDHPWRIRYLNSFCPRLFSAIRLPDPVLETRTIVIPLIRTDNKAKANADAMEYDLWPHDRRALIDNLWALALAHLNELPAYERRTNEQVKLIGRDLEPWRAILAVALWLEDKGAKGLYKQIEAIAMNYQSERQNLRSDDLTTLIIIALCEIAAEEMSQGHSEEWSLATQDITDRVIQIAETTESTISRERITSIRVGKVLGKMRFKYDPRSGGQGGRKRIVTYRDLQRWTTTYGVDLSVHQTRTGVRLSTLISTAQNQTGSLGPLGSSGSGVGVSDGPGEPVEPDGPSSNMPLKTEILCYTDNCGSLVGLTNGRGHCEKCGIDLVFC